jgi:hypothetical protein
MPLRKHRGKALAAVVFLGASLIAVSPAAAATPKREPAAAASCLGGAWKYTKASGEIYAPPGAAYYRTTSRCADIQVKPDQVTVLRLCYLKNHDPGQPVCKGWVDVYTGRWTVLGTDFKDGVEFWFEFSNVNARKTGLVAA